LNRVFPAHWLLRRALPVLGAIMIGLPSPTDSEAQVAGPAVEDSGRLPLWEVSRGGNTVYLLGSVHMLRPDAYPLDPALYEAFDAARVVAFEIDLGEAAAAAPRMLMRGMYTDGRSLRSELPADLYTRLDDKLAGFGISAQLVAPMKPWLVSMTLSSVALQQVGFTPELGVDMHFFERAGEGGKRIVALETIEDQIDVFDGLTPDQQIALLESTLTEMDSIRDRMDEITAIWASGDSERLSQLMNESLLDQPVLTEGILYDRNRKWLPQIEAMVASGEPAIVIVGMGHMVGEQSVTDLLIEAGYEVTPVTAVPR